MTTTSDHPHLSTADLADIQQHMLRFARNQLADDSLAEDAVQEALIKTITHHDSFKGKSAYKSWVFAILKNTITDMLRKHGREVQMSSLTGKRDDDNQGDALLDTLFDNSGHWQKVQKPAKWDTPDESLEQDSFWQVMEACLNNLPSEQARVFMMREYIGLDTKEICTECNITTSKFYVVMHRARLKLQTCLSAKWFDHGNQTHVGDAHA